MALLRRELLTWTAAAGAWRAAAGLVATVATNGCGVSGAGDDAAPLAPGLPDGDYFRQLGADLTAAGFGTPQIVIDLDRLDANADAIVGEIGSDRYRIVEKSLPSLDLLGYISKRTGVERFLLLHLPFLPALLAAFPTAQVLVGKNQPIAAVKSFFDGLASDADRADAAARVQFLVDGSARLGELVALATAMSLVLQVGIELDVGLHRGGVRRPSDLPPVLAGFAAHADRVRFIGILGYDGHIIGAPAAPGLEKKSVVAAYQSVEATFRASVDIIQSQFPSLWRSDLVFNSGGTNTFPLHHGGVVNDVATGGGMLRPNSYSDMFTGALQPALFLAAPVIARFDAVELPFVDDVGQSVEDGNQSFSMYGGGWAAVFVWPRNCSLAPLVNDPENMNLVPNQTLVVAPGDITIAPGDWIFHQPRVADAIFQFENILLVRGGRLQPETFRAYPRRY
ncbi:MAG TPA: alanine racemase [Polyangiaceae bacterium]|jgi:D-serine deaminase-like pyridoxal phosphate-dependent protein